MAKIGKAFLVLLGAAAIAWAGEPWKGKPYQTWDRRDVMKVLNDSPWARVVRVSASWKPAETTPGISAEGEGTGGAGGGGAAAPGGGQAPGGYGGGGGGMGRTGGGAPTTPSGGIRVIPEAAFKARWLSSRVIREALARLQMLNGGASEAQMEAYLAQEPPGYQFWLQGSDMTPFEKLDEKALELAAYLKMKKTHERVQAASVQIVRDQHGKVTGLIYTFPKTLGNGEPAIPQNEKQAEFVCRVSTKTTLRFPFDLAKMVDEKGREL